MGTHIALIAIPETMIVLIVLGCIAWVVWAVWEHKQASEIAALGQAWREVLDDPHYMERRHFEERKRRRAQARRCCYSLIAERYLTQEDQRPMKNIKIGLAQTEEEIFAFEVSDEALEIAAGSTKEKANFTLGACSGLSVCPG
jgi:hypothetical protein